MKRIALVLVALGAVGLFSGCKKGKKEVKPEDQAAKPTDTTAPATPTDQTQPATPTPAAGDQAAQPANPATPAAAGDQGAAAAAAPSEADLTTGIAECDALLKKEAACEKFPNKDSLKQAADGYKAAKAKGDKDAKKAADDCKKATPTAEKQLKDLGC
jgi:hypothetical protein